MIYLYYLVICLAIIGGFDLLLNKLKLNQDYQYFCFFIGGLIAWIVIKMTHVQYNLYILIGV